LFPHDWTLAENNFLKFDEADYLWSCSFTAYQERLRVMALRSLDNLSRRKRVKVPTPSRQWRDR
jgi:hypothetical protein